jgi:hypothetical protein
LENGADEGEDEVIFSFALALLRSEEEEER